MVSYPLSLFSAIRFSYNTNNNKDPKLIALDVANGNQRWVKNRPGKICWSSPSIAYVNRKPQLILMGNPAITAYDPNSGEQLWQVDCMGGEVWFLSV